MRVGSMKGVVTLGGGTVVRLMEVRSLPELGTLWKKWRSYYTVSVSNRMSSCTVLTITIATLNVTIDRRYHFA
jgi:hypothetical protein